MNANSHGLDGDPKTVTVGTRWVFNDPDPFRYTVIEITDCMGNYVQFKYAVLHRQPWDSQTRMSEQLKGFHKFWISPNCDEAKAIELGITIEEYQDYVKDMEEDLDLDKASVARQQWLEDNQEAPV